MKNCFYMILISNMSIKNSNLLRKTQRSSNSVSTLRSLYLQFSVDVCKFCHRLAIFGVDVFLIVWQPSKDGYQPVVTKLNVAAGLAELMCMKYKAAARLFLAANFDHVDFPEVTGTDLSSRVSAPILDMTECDLIIFVNSYL